MFHYFVKRASYANRSVSLQRTTTAGHHLNHKLFRGTSCCTRGVGPQQESLWTASINLSLPTPSTITRQISSSRTCLRIAHHGGQYKSINSAIQRNKRIIAFGKEGNWKAMLSLHAQEKKDFNIVNYASLMTFIARIRYVNINHPQFLEFTDDIAHRVENDEFLQMPRELSNIIYSFGKMNLKKSSAMKIMDWLSNKDKAQIFVEKSTAQNISNVVLAHAKLQKANIVLFETIDRNCNRIFEESDQQAISNTMWGFGKLRFKPYNLLSYVETRAEWLVQNGDPQAISNTAWAFATLGMEAPKLFLHVEKHAKWIVENGDLQAISNTAWAFATGKIQGYNFFNSIEKNAKWLVENGNPQDISNTAWAFASLGITASNLFAHIEKQAEWLVENGDPQAVANTVWAFASLGVTAPNLFLHVEEEAQWLVENGNPQDLANTAWAFASLGVTAPKLFNNIDKQAEWIVKNGNPQAVANIAWAFASLGVTAPNLFLRIEEEAQWLKSLDLHLEKISANSNVQVVTNISYAIALLGSSKKHERLLLHLWKTALQMDPKSFQKESMSQLVQVKIFAEADGVKLPEIPLQLHKKMSEINDKETQSRYQNEVSACLTDLGFVHDVEVPPVDDCVIEGMLAIDMACKERKIAIECDGPHHFMKDIKTGNITRMENGATKAKRRFLVLNGWTVININYQDWMKAGKKATKKQFLRKTLIQTGVEL